MVRGVRSYHPFVLFMYYVLVIAALMLYQHPIFLLTSLIMIIGVNLLLDGGRGLRTWGWAIAVMGLLILVLTPLFNQHGQHILFYWMDRPVLLEAIVQGVMIVLTLAGIMALFITFNIVLTADKFLYLFAKITPQWALLTMLSMRFVPLLERKIKDMEAVQSVKGLSLKHGTIKQRAQNGMQLLQMLLTGSLEDSIQAADSMTARGYGLQKRSQYQAFKMKRGDWFTLGFFAITSAVLFYGWSSGAGVLQLMPEFEQIWQGGLQFLLLPVWLLLIGFPIFAEGKEVIKWTLYQHKTSDSPTPTHQKTR